MEFEFDKEIDVLLRKARDSENAPGAEDLSSAFSAPPSAFSIHPDADSISAFAENALPESAKEFCTAHLAECARCRKILSNVMALNSEADAFEAASARAAQPEIRAATVPWYRKLFVFPQIAYTMGALVVLLSGFLGFLVLQSLTGSQNSEVSFSTKNASAPQAAPPAVSTANTASTNTASATNTAAATTVANSAPALSNSNASVPAATNSAARNTEPASPLATPGILSDAPRDDKAVREEEKAVSIPPPSADAANSPVAGSTARKQEVVPQKENVLRSQQDAVTAPRPQPKVAVPEEDESARAEKKKKDSRAGEKRAAGGKIFNNIGGVWFDSEYNKQPQITVRRGSSEYQKLDSGLRSIAEAFGGTVIVLWKGKAYRIQ